MSPSNIAQYDLLRVFCVLSIMLLIGGCSSEDIANTIHQNDQSSELNPPVNRELYDINLSWAAPSERENKEPISLSEIAGYKVYYGTSRRDYLNSIDIKDGSADSYTFRNLVSGTYYFALTTYDTAGRESQLSEEVEIII